MKERDREKEGEKAIVSSVVVWSASSASLGRTSVFGASFFNLCSFYLFIILFLSRRRSQQIYTTLHGLIMAATLETREISAPRVGKFNIHIQGNLKQCQFIIMTVHDLGCNYYTWKQFIDQPCMEEIRKRAAFIHVDIPGQEDGAADLPADYTFPSMQTLGEDLVCILDQLEIKQVVLIGEGAGANIIARFAMVHPTRALGICLIHCTGTTAGFMESLKDKVMNWKLNHIGMNPTAEAYLMLHRFGSFEKAQNKEQLELATQCFLDNLRSKINPKNLKKFVEAFMNRNSLTDNIGKVACPCLMVTGSKASFNHTVHALYQAMMNKIGNRKLLDLLEIDGVANVVAERPEELAESFLYMMQGLGMMGAVPMPRVQRSASQDGPIPIRGRSMSMEEADQPRGIYSTSPPRVTTHQ